MLAERLELPNELRYYHFVSQAELTIDGVDDSEEMKLTDVSLASFMQIDAFTVTKI